MPGRFKDLLQDVVKVGEDIEVKILRVDIDERKIGLSKKRVDWAEEDHAAAEAAEKAEKPTAANIPATELKGGIGGQSGPLIKTPGSE